MDSDPTYEAWKPIIKFRSSVPIPDSDPTYEAWKRSEKMAQAMKQAAIPILPTRHGNNKLLVYLFSSMRIPILPTRHGN